MKDSLSIVVLGLTLSSSWGNGHATTYRALLKGLAEEGHETLFLERDVPWYAAHRDLPDPDFCTLRLYASMADLSGWRSAIREADAVIVGSYVPEGVDVIDLAAAFGPRLLCFYDIDTPVTLARLENGDRDYLAPRQVRLFDLYFSFAGGRALSRLEQEHGARRAVPLYCAVDPALYAPVAEEPRWDLGYLGTYSADRQPALERLLIEPARRLPQCRFVVAGPQYPSGIDWPANVERIEHLPPAEHRAFYGRQRYTLNVTRKDMVACGWSPSVRLFEAAACGTPIISDRWDGLDALLPDGEAIVIADGTEAVVDELATSTQERRNRIAQAARERVLAAHTGRSRARELVAALRQASATGQRADHQSSRLTGSGTWA